MKQPTPSILERLSAIITILIFLLPDVSASAHALMERPWRSTHSVHPHNIEYTGLPTTPALSEIPVVESPMRISGGSHMVLLGGHPSDALNKPVDDVVEFEVLNLDMTQSARISFHKSTSETVGLTINGQHFFEVVGTSAVVPSACLMEGTNTVLFASQLGHPVAITDVQFDVTAAEAHGASVLASALESNFIANAFESDNTSSSDLSFALKSYQTAAIPLSLSNITRGATAYRSAASDKVITVKIGVQRTLGQSQLREAQVMYFDYTSHSWQKAFVKEVDHENFMVEADVPGGTDYFAALIKTPEMPEAAAFMPTAISDLEPKTPAEGITLIQPPTANQQGDAIVSYPLSLPPGRQGMAPQLVLSYSSSGGELVRLWVEHSHPKHQCGHPLGSAHLRSKFRN